jgi:hypothetical protein
MRRPLRDRPDGPDEERLFDLMRERAVHGLGDDEMRELNRLAALHPDVDVDCYDRAAAALDLGFGGLRVERMPAELARRVASLAPRTGSTAAIPRAPGVPASTSRPRTADRAAAAPRAPSSGPRPDPRSPWFGWGGWIAAAAASVLVILGWTRSQSSPDPEMLARELQAQVNRAQDHVVLPWKPTEDPDGRNVSGELHWSTALQKGYMHFRGLPTNDPSQKQYQLWIFDKPRGMDHPVDGGVFDVAAGEVVIPIDAKIRVSDPALFAVTAELPGGVVVSKREHILSLAQF